ncbi:MAG TPA: transcription antitermination factor NusB [Balneolaceae bacterium]|nr:transcription antitermination factor NusB [Balneolaceae bacterium]
MVQRREARQLVIQAVYAEDLSGSDSNQLFNTIIKPHFSGDRKNYSFAERLFFQTVNHKDELDQIIQNHIKNWRLGRLAVVDKIVLRVAICEFLYFEEIPTKVTINEAIEIAKDYSTSNSGKFINGILDAALERLQSEGKIQKKGRGLIESSIN